MDTDSNQDIELSQNSTFTSFSLPRFNPSTSSLVFRITLGKKSDYLFEITTIRNEQKISETNLPLAIYNRYLLSQL